MKPQVSQNLNQLITLSPILHNLEELTTQERKVLQYTIFEFSCKEIAEELSVSTETIKKHRKNIMKKLGVKGKTQFRRLLYHITVSTPKIPLTYPLGGIDTP